MCLATPKHARLFSNASGNLQELKQLALHHTPQRMVPDTRKQLQDRLSRGSRRAAFLFFFAVPITRAWGVPVLPAQLSWIERMILGVALYQTVAPCGSDLALHSKAPAACRRPPEAMDIVPGSEGL
jgi:hypothetical protein